MADLEIQKGKFKVVGVAHTAAERWLLRKQLFCRRVWGHAPPGKFFYSEAILEHSEAYFSATEPDSPHFHEQTSTMRKLVAYKVSRFDVLKVQISSCTLGK